MTNHPNRSQRLVPGPTPAEVLAARNAVGLTQTEAAQLIHASLRAWQHWEQPPGAEGSRSMHPGLFELFLLKTGQLNLDDLTH